MARRSQYGEIAARLTAQITGGELEAGQQLPTEQELAVTHQVSRNTVRLALAEVQNAGLVESRPGRGYFVTTRAPFTYRASHETVREGVPRADFLDTAVSDSGHAPRKELELRIQSATPNIASRLGIEERALVVVRRVFRFIDDTPMCIETSFYPMDIAEGTELHTYPDDIERGAIQVLAEKGHRQVGYVDTVETRMATPFEQGFLDLSPGVPVLEFYRTAYSTERAIRVTRSIYAGNAIRLQYEVGDVTAADL